jgi:multicomponent K+:H+ antiporter subunit E
VKRLLPQPAMSVSLLAAWLLLHNSVDGGAVVLGIALAVALPLFTDRFWPEYPSTIRIGPLVRLVGVVLFDIIIANVRVAILIIGPARRWKPKFIVIPLDLRQPFPITLLASIISLTPGTVSANLSGDRRSLLVHDLVVNDAGDAVRRIKQRYERPLKEIFE